MEYSKLVEDRRSCRSYIEAKPSKEDIEAIVECALMAPSWKNSETGRYYVALDDEAIKEVYESLPDFNKTSSKNAAYIIATYKKGISGNGDDNWGAYDLGLQNSYLILKATELGYDTLIMGLRDEDRLRKFFSIPEGEIMLPVIAIGKKSKALNLNPRKNIDEVLKIK